jgi:hypothetical protein
LTQQLRSTLEAASDPNLPIDLTEIGQPIAPSGPGPTTPTPDRSATAQARRRCRRPATRLAHSDCGVQSFDIYGLAGSGTNLEPANEGYMGISTTRPPRRTRPAPRWSQPPGAGGLPRAAGLVLCGSGTTPTGALLPLGLQLTHT